MEETHKNTISILKHLLIRTNNAREAYKNAAKNVHNRPMVSFFEDAANMHNQFSESLKQEIKSLGGNPKDKTSLSADAEHFWLDLASIIVRRNESAMLNNCAEAEEKTIAEYDKLINQNDLTENARDMLKQQRDKAQALRDKVRDLRSHYASD